MKIVLGGLKATTPPGKDDDIIAALSTDYPEPAPGVPVLDAPVQPTREEYALQRIVDHVMGYVRRHSGDLAAETARKAAVAQVNARITSVQAAASAGDKA